MCGRAGSVLFGCGLLRVFITFQVWFLSWGSGQALASAVALQCCPPRLLSSVPRSCKVALFQALLHFLN